ncbi:MAG: GNAT family N-acetyltransferase [Planctomycetes bacterium]|nr:GNAT family N-acetyltransferase [Planctomycetota bacterium]
MSGYEIKTHAEIGDVLQGVIELARTSFAEYEGVIAVDEAFMRWYLTRPGMRPEHCFAAVHAGHIVSNAFVTITKVQFGGEVLDVGMVDTVMTHPEHRRKGLARKVLTAALDFMRTHDLDASQLYTGADSMPQRFYESLGYREYTRVRYYIQDMQQRLNLLAVRSPNRESARPTGAVRACKSDDVPGLRRFLAQSFQDCDGYLPLNDDLWAWRRERRPNSLPTAMYVLTDDHSEIRGTATLASAPLITDGGTEMMTGILDFAAAEETANAFFERIVSIAPSKGALVATSGVANEPFNGLCESCGFTCMALEVAMVNPFSDRARSAVASEPAQWYTATESLIGI